MVLLGYSTYPYVCIYMCICVLVCVCVYYRSKLITLVTPILPIRNFMKSILLPSNHYLRSTSLYSLLTDILCRYIGGSKTDDQMSLPTFRTKSNQYLCVDG